MKQQNPNIWAVALGAAAATTFFVLPQARGELVYEQQDTQSDTAQAARVEDRGELRQALGTSERAQATLQAQQSAQQGQTSPQAGQVTVAPAVQPVAQNLAPSAMPDAVSRGDDAGADIQNMTKAELMRRERVREELRNEDALQERLEELRLRDERRRTDQILGVSSDASGDSSANATGVNMPKSLYGADVQEQAVVSPVTDHPGQAAVAPTPVAPAAAPSPGPMLASAATASMMDQNGTTGVSTAVDHPDLRDASDRTVFSVMPRFGIGNMIGQQGYNISGRFSTGVGLNIATSNNISFDIGYSFSQYGVAIGSSNPLVAMMQPMTGDPDTIAMNQNVIEAGMKYTLLSPDAKIRPFVGGGAGYAKGYINYDSQYLSAMNSMPQAAAMGMTSDYELNQFLGYLSAGLDLPISKSMTVELIGKYYTVLSATENAPLNNMGFFPSYGPMMSPSKQYVTGSLAYTSFYSVLGGLSFAF